MSSTKNLLVELLVEELPPKSLKKLGEAFAAEIAKGLRAQGLAGEQSAVTPFASPRRLAVHVSGVLARAADRSVSIKLMPAAVGLAADGSPCEDAGVGQGHQVPLKGAGACAGEAGDVAKVKRFIRAAEQQLQKRAPGLAQEKRGEISGKICSHIENNCTRIENTRQVGCDVQPCGLTR